MKYKKTTLKNGLRIITAPMKGTQTATIFIAVGVGSRYEEKKEAGLSHFIEHMLFKGTKKRPNTQTIANELDSIGGEFNASTGKIRTAYYAKVDARHIDTAMDVLTDMFLNSKIAGQEINREKGTILQELNMYEDLPMHKIEDDFEELLYGKQRLGRPIIGKKKTIANFQRRDFVNYLNKFYLANNTVVCIAGKINEQKIISQLKKYFSGMNKKIKPEMKIAEENQKNSKVKICYKKTDQTHFVLGVRAYNDKNKDRFALNLLANILGGNMSSRLFIQIRERQGLAYYVRAGVEMYQDVGYLSVSAGVEHKNLSKAIKTILGEFKKISRRKINESELQKAKDYIKGKTIMGMESSSAVAGFLAEQEVIHGKIKTPNEIFDKIEAITVMDIQRVAKDIFTLEKLNLAVIGPHKNKQKLKKILNINL